MHRGKRKQCQKNLAAMIIKYCMIEHVVYEQAFLEMCIWDQGRQAGTLSHFVGNKDFAQIDGRGRVTLSHLLQRWQHF